ncbi:MAG: hypothetical protein ABI232_07785 [Jatrophihabitantaceae bacterium]
MAILFAPVLIALAVVTVDLWVFTDARRWARVGTPVVFRLGSLTIATPEAWALACLLLFIFFVPVYAVARRG